MSEQSNTAMQSTPQPKGKEPHYRQRNITPGRIQKLHITANNVIKATGMWGSIAECKEEWLYPEFGVTTTKDLTIAQADEAINSMMKMLGDENVRITYGQEQKLKALRKLLGWSKEGLYKFIQRQTQRRKSERMLTRIEATQIIVGLQRIFCGDNEKLFKKLNRASHQWISSPEGRAELIKLKG